MTEQNPTIMLFREDLRIQDNIALTSAVERGSKILCLFVDDEKSLFARGSAQKWWLHHSLKALEHELQNKMGCPLNIKSGSTQEILHSVIAACQADQVFWSRRYAPHQTATDKELKASLEKIGVKVVSCKGRLLAEPWETLNDGNPYRVFTPFWKRMRAHVPIDQPLPAPKSAHGMKLPTSLSIEDLRLLHSNSELCASFHANWQPGEAGASQRLEQFFVNGACNYSKGRDFPSLSSVTRLSPHIQMGDISPRQILFEATRQFELGRIDDKNYTKFYSELAWREFSYSLLYHFPSVTDEEFRPAFKYFPWQDNRAGQLAWESGQTGYPIVDAGMRELRQTGYMHNRIRMVTASFLTKHLLIDWRVGMKHFWDLLLDADIASNTLSWQWVTGCGADAAPYFRIFNPILQARKFDPDGDYIRRWIPELSQLPTSHLADPWLAPTDILEDAGVRLGETYPYPIVDHAFARVRAMDAYRSLKTAPS